jgi:hypothetical protein
MWIRNSSHFMKPKGTSLCQKYSSLDSILNQFNPLCNKFKQKYWKFYLTHIMIKYELIYQSPTYLLLITINILIRWFITNRKLYLHGYIHSFQRSSFCLLLVHIISPLFCIVTTNVLRIEVLWSFRPLSYNNFQFASIRFARKYKETKSPNKFFYIRNNSHC